MAREVEHLKGLDMIVEERLRQVEQLGYTIPHDNEEHSVDELLRIGVCYADAAASEEEGMSLSEEWGVDEKHPFWPEDSTISWKLEVSPMENATKGAAFIAAALDLMHAQIMGETGG